MRSMPAASPAGSATSSVPFVPTVPAFPINDSKDEFARMKIPFDPRLTMTALSAAFLCLAPMASAVAASEQAEATGISHAANQVRLAQSGSMGGTIGNREKSLSGSRDVESERSAHREKPRRSQREAPARRSGGGNFDGVWTVVSRGCSGAGTGSIVVSGGRIVGQGVSGSISSNGAIRSVVNLGNGGVSIGSGRASGRTASGIYRQSDGCTGRFTAVRN